MMTQIVQDIPRSYTAIAEWLACMMFAAQYRPRIPQKQYALTAAAGLVLQTAFLQVTDDVHDFFWIPCMMVAVGLMLLLVCLLCDLDIRSAGYVTIRAFILAEFTAAFQWQLHCYLWPANDPPWFLRYGLLILVYAACYFIIGSLEVKCSSREFRQVVTPGELMTVISIGVTVFAVSNLSFYFRGALFSSIYASEIMNIRTLVDLGGVAILFAYHSQRYQAHAKKELDAMQSILESQYAQYKMSRESIDMINRKYHDLKHQIHALRSEQDPSVRERWLDEMEEDIRNYEAQNKTGNTVLDTFLTGKSLYCQKHGIDLYVVADGQALGFMDVMDICTIFGNALDNAIECELKIPDKEKRMIHVVLTRQKQFLVLRVENYCPVPPEFKDGLPVSTKPDSANHGFGVRSIQRSARKYGGTVTTGAENGWFVLTVLIPLTEQ